MPVSVEAARVTMVSRHGRRTTTLPRRNGQWLIAMVKSRQERALANDLQAKRVSYFLPVLRTTVRGSHNQLDSFSPLFPGFCFVHGPPEVRYEVSGTRRTCGFIDAEGQAQWTLERDLTRILQALQAKLELVRVIPTVELAGGQRCRICTGVLQGLEATILRATPASAAGVQRIVLDVAMVGAAEFQTTNEMIELLKPAQPVGH